MIKEKRTRLSPAWLFWQIQTRSLFRGSVRDDPTRRTEWPSKMGCVQLPVCKVLSSTPPGSLPGCRRWGCREAHSTSPLILTHPCHVLAVCPWQITKPSCASASFTLHRERLVSVGYLVWVSWSCCHRPSRTGGFQQQERPLSQLQGPEARRLGVRGAVPPPEALRPSCLLLFLQCPLVTACLVLLGFSSSVFTRVSPLCATVPSPFRALMSTSSWI